MKIRIHGFRCYDDTEYNFVDSDLSLLKGPSGIGKSTILQAITWCLYGKIIRGTDAKNNKSGKLFVQLEYKGIKVYRQKRPNTVTFTDKDNKVYESEIAETMIRNYFGNSVLWNAVGYIQQGELNKLLSASNNDRMELLNTLAFEGLDDPEVQIEKINNILRTVEAQYSFAENMFNNNLKEYTTLLTPGPLNKGIDMSKVFLDSTLVIKAEERLKILNDEISKLSQLYYLHLNAESKVVSIQQTIDKFKNIIVKDEDLLLAQENKQYTQSINDINNKLTRIAIEISKISDKRNNILIINNIKKRLSEIDKQLLVIPPSDHNESTIIDMSLIQEVHAQEIKYKQQFDIYQIVIKFIPELEYTQESINTYVKKLQQYIEFCDVNNKINDLDININKIKNICDQPIGDSTLTLDDVKTKLNEIQKNYQLMIISLNEMQCPHCNKCVKYDGIAKVLRVGSATSIFNQSEFDTNRREYAKYNDYLNKYELRNNSQNQLNLLVQQREVLSKKLNKDISIVNLNMEVIQKILPLLCTLKVVEMPKISSASLITKQKYYQLFTERKQLLLNTNIDDKSLDETTFESLNVEFNTLNSQRDQLIKDIQELQKKIDHNQHLIQSHIINMKTLKYNEEELINTTKLLVPNIKEDLQKLRAEESTLKNNLEETRKYNELIKKRNKLEDERKTLESLGVKRSKLNKMKELAIQCECYQLSVVVESLNTAIAAIAAYLFDLPIIIKLNLFKTVKTSQRVKPSVNLTVSYKGMEYDNINMLSGGERDRVSLCITLAMNQISGCPLLFLDEVIGTLDATMTEIAIKSIKFATVGKTCLLVSHSAVEGVFQDVVNCVGT